MVFQSCGRKEEDEVEVDNKTSDSLKKKLKTNRDRKKEQERQGVMDVEILMNELIINIVADQLFVE